MAGNEMNIGLYTTTQDLLFPAQVTEDEVVTCLEYFKLPTGTVLLWLSDFELTKEKIYTGNFDLGFECVKNENIEHAICSSSSMSFSGGSYFDVYDFAHEELSVAEKVAGSVFLTPCLKKIWLSHYTCKELHAVR